MTCKDQLDIIQIVIHTVGSQIHNFRATFDERQRNELSLNLLFRSIVIFVFYLFDQYILTWKCFTVQVLLSNLQKASTALIFCAWSRESQ